MAGSNLSHPIFSPVALAATVLLIIGLTAYVAVSGGRVFSPGELSNISHGTTLSGVKSHAAFHDDCGQCHAPWSGISAERCLRCHTMIEARAGTGAGLHALFDNVDRCQACHQEHGGTNIDLRNDADSGIDHSLTHFALTGHMRADGSQAASCSQCHTVGASFPEDTQSCVSCHQQESAAFMTDHLDSYGDDCLACHDGVDTMAGLQPEHHSPRFPLAEAHLIVSCAGCHSGARAPKDLKATPTACSQCHVEPENHRGNFAADCGRCHDTTAFLPAYLDVALFNHDQDTGFQLVRHVVDFQGNEMNCANCHAADNFDFAPSLCVRCHQISQAEFMPQHIQQFGPACLDCHDGQDRMGDFDHGVVFPLTGKHAALSCADCHQPQQYQNAPSTCDGCHLEPVIHQGLFGAGCDNCHNANGWRPARLVHHIFPLDHGDQGVLPCSSCHQDTFTSYTCFQCHELGEMEREHAEVGGALDQLADCTACHPSGVKQE